MFFGANANAEFDGLFGIALIAIGYVCRLLVESRRKRATAARRAKPIEIPQPLPPPPIELPTVYSFFPSRHELMLDQDYVAWGQLVVTGAEQVGIIVCSIADFITNCQSSGPVPSKEVLTKRSWAITHVEQNSISLETSARQVHEAGLKLPKTICDLETAMTAAVIVRRLGASFVQMEFTHEQEGEMLAQLEEQQRYWQSLAQPWLQRTAPIPDWQLPE